MVKRIRHTSTARAKQLREYRVEKVNFLFTHTHCAKCNDWVTFEERDLHHWAGRNGRLLCWVPGFRMVCRECHDWIKMHTWAARSLDLVAPEGLWNDYERVVTHYEAHR